PILRPKVDALKRSITATTFWDNLLARKRPSGDGYEAPYGHHRLVALTELGDKEIDIPVRPLSDTDMARILATENMEEWGHSSSIEQETVRSIIEGYAEGKIELPPPPAKARADEVRYAPMFKVGHVPSSGSAHAYTILTLAEFLGWKTYK